MLKLHLKNAHVRAEFVQNPEFAKEYPDPHAALICLRVFEFAFEKQPFRQTRSLAIYLRSIEIEQARTLSAYSQALRNAIRLRRFSKRFRETRSLRGPVALKLNQLYFRALGSTRELEKAFLTTIGPAIVADPTTVIPLYQRPHDEYIWPKDMTWPSPRGITPLRAEPDEFALQLSPSKALEGTAFEHRSYFLYRHHVWSAGLADAPSQWASMVDSVLRPKNQPSGNSRQSIPESVRIFVWRRDDGKCSRCGSRERLEYDHIIAVINGGSNTARNIELLCEVCNRAKGAKVR